MYINRNYQIYNNYNNISNLKKETRNISQSFAGFYNCSQYQELGLNPMNIKKKDIPVFMECYLEGNYKQPQSNWETFDPKEVILSDQNLYRFSDSLITFIRLATYDDMISNNDLSNILKKYSVDNDSQILDTLKKLKINSREAQRVLSHIKLRKEFLREAAISLQTLDESEYDLYDNSWELKDYFDEIISKIYTKYKESTDNYDKQIAAKLSYSKTSDVEKVNLNEEFLKLPAKMQEDLKYSHGDNYLSMMLEYISLRSLTSNITMYPPEFEKGLLQLLPRYNVPESKNTPFKYEPMFRWLVIDDVKSFLSQFSVGEVYSYPRSQSCAKSTSGSEIWFSDARPEQNVKLRIHPKSKMSKAYDIANIDFNKLTNYEYADDMCSRTFNKEVVYPAGTKFKVLGIQTTVQNNCKRSLDTIPDYHKIVIDLQEV